MWNTPYNGLSGLISATGFVYPASASTGFWRCLTSFPRKTSRFSFSQKKAFARRHCHESRIFATLSTRVSVCLARSDAPCRTARYSLHEREANPLRQRAASRTACQNNDAGALRHPASSQHRLPDQTTRSGSCQPRSSGAGAQRCARRSRLRRWESKWSWWSSLRRPRQARPGAGRF